MAKFLKIVSTATLEFIMLVPDETTIDDVAKIGSKERIADELRKSMNTADPSCRIPALTIDTIELVTV